MGKNPSDEKDALIMQQFDLLNTMTRNNMRRMGADFWGNPVESGQSANAPGQSKADAPDALPDASGAFPQKSVPMRLRLFCVMVCNKSNCCMIRASFSSEGFFPMGLLLSVSERFSGVEGAEQ